MAEKPTNPEQLEREESKRAFFITPIGEAGSEARRTAEGICRVIRRILNEHGFSVVKAGHHLEKPGSINDQVIRCVLEWELAVADLSGPNPNVMYELAIRHCAGKPVITIAKKGTNNPFDVYDLRTIRYAEDALGLEEFAEEFDTVVRATLQDDGPENPVYRVATDAAILAVRRPDNPAEYKLDRIMETLRGLEIAVREGRSSREPVERDSPGYAWLGDANLLWVVKTEEAVTKLEALLSAALMDHARSKGPAGDYLISAIPTPGTPLREITMVRNEALKMRGVSAAEIDPDHG